ncbi:MAG: GNAT family N-acetyltransferase [Candidatus Dactylopiibacterium sp.]|nr:GNAT family N-acetyltransferase [Candidatus Dactylopiibacterium sp.]
MTPFTTRDFRPADAAALAALARRAVRETASDAYTAPQCAAWAARFDDATAWAQRLQDAWVRVAEDANGAIAGFGAIQMSGQIDLLFTAPEHTRQGVASLVLADLLELAAAMGAGTLSVHASDLSRPVFERHGFRVIESRLVDCGPEQLRHHAMQKP